jgi:hypothetical protein
MEDDLGYDCNPPQISSGQPSTDDELRRFQHETIHASKEIRALICKVLKNELDEL